ncbi:hypothetical protein LDO26_16750 [Luteimonas sp. BDR2-5]|uniref:hypothetical protein n=1 Tax=Proluteimonas luteida TaxID=2878685 RepID=UPI001E37C0D5|nr:hypothetical protein [Luteimonas sp. BDR2-5]MCD9029842.1 hypothetical protein [Luteimonas sp. BDR2-5]
MSGSDRAPRCVRTALLAATLLSLAACGGGEGPAVEAVVGNAGGAAPPRREQGADTAPARGGGARAADAATVAPGLGARELAYPEDLQMVLLGYRLEGRQPPIAEWAAAQHRVASANEFERADVREQERERLQAVYDGTEGIGLLRLNVDARIGEYDGSRGGYYLDAFTPGSVFRFSARPAPNPFRDEAVSLRIDNPGELNFWALDTAAAQDVLAKNGGQRHVMLDSRLRITGIDRRSGGPELTATLLRYAIVSTRYQQPTVLGELRFDDASQGE